MSKHKAQQMILLLRRRQYTVHPEHAKRLYDKAGWERPDHLK